MTARAAEDVAGSGAATSWDALLVVDLDVPLDELAQFEWAGEPDKSFREWLIPAAWLAKHVRRIVPGDGW